MSWNAARNPRGEGAYAVYATPEGLWVGSDTDWIGNFQYRRGKLALLPLAGGAGLAGEALPTLPGAIYRGATVAGATAYTSTAFDGAWAVNPTALSDPGLAPSSIRGSTTIGGRLFYGRADATFAYRALAPGGSLGPEVLIDPYNDPAWSNVDTGSGQTYRGAKPNFYAEIPSISAMWYEAGKLYYTTNGPTVYSRSFSPDSGVIHPQKATVSSPLPAISGAFLTGGQLYYVAASDGALWKVGFSGGTFSGTPERLTGPGVSGVDWRAPLLFLARPANQAPLARRAAVCTYLSCAFNTAGSIDGDGTITAYAWDFGDGSTGNGNTPTHTYAAAGSYAVTLTVTDNDGATATATTTVTATDPPNTPPVAVPSGSCVDLQCTFTSAGSNDPDGRDHGILLELRRRDSARHQGQPDPHVCRGGHLLGHADRDRQSRRHGQHDLHGLAEGAGGVAGDVRRRAVGQQGREGAGGGTARRRRRGRPAAARRDEQHRDDRRCPRGLDCPAPGFVGDDADDGVAAGGDGSRPARCTGRRDLRRVDQGRRQGAGLPGCRRDHDGRLHRGRRAHRPRGAQRRRAGAQLAVHLLGGAGHRHRDPDAGSPW